MNDLIEFIKARLDDDEQVARDASRYDDEDAGEWRISYGWHRVARHRKSGTGRRESLPPGAPSPARVLAEVDAKRRLLARIGQWLDVDDDYDPVQTSFRAEAEPVVREIALPYAGHPDYREEWRP